MAQNSPPMPPGRPSEHGTRRRTPWALLVMRAGPAWPARTSLQKNDFRAFSCAARGRQGELDSARTRRRSRAPAPGAAAPPFRDVRERMDQTGFRPPLPLRCISRRIRPPLATIYIGADRAGSDFRGRPRPPGPLVKGFCEVDFPKKRSFPPVLSLGGQNMLFSGRIWSIFGIFVAISAYFRRKRRAWAKGSAGGGAEEKRRKAKKTLYWRPGFEYDLHMM